MFTIYFTIFSSAFIAELLGYGLITRYHSNNMYEMITATNNEGLFVILYTIFFIVLPICSIISLHKARYYLLDRDKTDRLLVR